MDWETLTFLLKGSFKRGYESGAEDGMYYTWEEKWDDCEMKKEMDRLMELEREITCSKCGGSVDVKGFHNAKYNEQFDYWDGRGSLCSKCLKEPDA